MRKVKTAREWLEIILHNSIESIRHPLQSCIQKTDQASRLIALNNPMILRKPPQNSSRYSGKSSPILPAVIVLPMSRLARKRLPLHQGEVATVIHHLSKKSTRTNGIDIIIIQQIFKEIPFLLMEHFNTCLNLVNLILG
ncbi:hypothetical protein AVEN_236798-1 [Araneus ventricosus]|uniref:Reverse transcriptase domain-containing protein n=1 Tax=Araneus ventricosus TaxID=182803 RepID=A0A4Y2K8V9_ARAVE|nr:hypothetical protein AVEN_236798-1 [Araneus ventricosus]